MTLPITPAARASDDAAVRTALVKAIHDKAAALATLSCAAANGIDGIAEMLETDDLRSILATIDNAISSMDFAEEAE